MKKVIYVLSVVFGNVLLAFGIAAFLEPTGIISGGTTGVGLVMREFFGLPVSITFVIVNVACFLMGFLILGKKFAMSTILSTVIFPPILGFFEGIPALSELTSDMLLCALLAGCITGAGVGIVVRCEASTGGLDIPPLIINKLFGTSVGSCVLVMNMAILLLQISFSDTEQILYGLVQTFLMSIVLDKVLLLGQRQAKLLIISPKFDEIRPMLLEHEVGVTLFPIETGYTGQAQKAVLCVTAVRKVPKLKDRIRSIDPAAFVLVDTSTEVMGRGFTLPR